jgi:hypothetical protein
LQQSIGFFTAIFAKVFVQQVQPWPTGGDLLPR